MNTLFFDTETTGLYNWKKSIEDSSQPWTVQLACILEDQDRTIRAMLNLLIRPKENVTIPVEASNIHGITWEVAEACGVEAVSALQVFGELVNAADLLVAHNIKFDSSVLETAYHRELVTYPASGKNQFCTMLSAMGVLKLPGRAGGYKWPKLNECYKFMFDSDLLGAHDAIIDVQACRKVYHWLKDNRHG